MTKAEWQACQSPLQMLEALRSSGPVSERKLRLTMCAACRLTWNCLPEASRHAVEVAEEMADGPVTQERQMQAVREAIEAACTVHDTEAERAAEMAYKAAYNDVWQAARSILGDGRDGEARTHVLRDIFGNPCRSSAPLLKRHDDHIVRLAREAYEHRTPDGVLDVARIAALADAVEQARFPLGVAEHLRDEKLRHYRGCFVIDALLRKEG